MSVRSIVPWSLIAVLGACAQPRPESPPFDAPGDREPVAVDEVAPSKDGASTPETHDPLAIGPRLPAAIVEGRSPSFVLELESGTGETVRTSLRLVDAGQKEELGAALVCGSSSFRVVRYVPGAFIEETLVEAEADEPGFPALLLRLRSGGPEWERWLAPGSRNLGRVQSVFAQVEYLDRPAPDEVKETERFLEQLYSPSPKLVFERKRDGRRTILPVREAAIHRIEDPPRRIEIVKFFKFYMKDMKTGLTVDQGERPHNPAVELRIEAGGEVRSAWLFSRLPRFSRGGEDSESSVSLVYPVADHPHPQVLATIVDGSPLQLYLGWKGEFHRRDLEPGSSVSVDGLDLIISRRLTHARVDQKIREDPIGRAAVLLRWQESGKPRRRWVPLGVTEELRVAGKIFLARLEPWGSAAGSGHELRPGGSETDSGSRHK